MTMLDERSKTTILTEAATMAQELISEIIMSLEAELAPLFYQKVTPAEVQRMTLTPEIVAKMAGEFSHRPDEEEPCEACRLIASRYGLEQQ